MDLSLIMKILSDAPTQVVPFLFCMALVGYLSYKAYQEFRKVYMTMNSKEAALLVRLADCESQLAKCDERTVMLSAKLSKIESSLEAINATLIRLSTTLEMHMKEHG